MKLFTNLSRVTVHPAGAAGMGVVTSSHALLLEPGDSGIWTRPQARGFSTEGAAQTFQLVIPSMEFKAREDENGPTIDLEIGFRLTRNGAYLEFADGTGLSLWPEDVSKPIAFDEFQDDPENNHYEECWETLEKRVADFWQSPYMPFLAHCPPSAVWGSRKAARLQAAMSAR